jgi:signal transduction histidine kinase
MFICWTLRSFTYFVYLLYLLHLSAFLFWGSNGLGFQFFSLPLEISYRLILYLGIMSMSLVCLLTIAFLDVKRLLPGWNRILRVSAGMNGLLALSSWILPIDLVQNLGNPSSGIIALLCAITAVRALWLRYPPARFFALGWAAFLISTILFVLQDEGLIEWAFVGHYGSQAGSAVEMILFSIALASRMRVVEEERKQAREELLETSQKLVKTLQESERVLEKKVEERTQTLQLVNEQLYQQSHEIERTNEQLQAQNERLVQLDIEKNEMLGIVSHDLKNPLGAVRNFGDLIRSGLLDSSQIQEIAGQIVSISNRMLELVKNLLDINRLESGSFQMQLVSLNVEPFLESAIWQYTAHCEAKNITVHFRNDAQESFVQADEPALTQVLDNLLSNAVKYSPHGKKIFVKMKSRKEAVRIEIQDEGPGISAEDMKKIFGKFARLTAQPTGGEHSNGLGLSIVKKMVELMNGNVWCESEFGKGATFIVELRKAE